MVHNQRACGLQDMLTNPDHSFGVTMLQHPAQALQDVPIDARPNGRMEPSGCRHRQAIVLAGHPWGDVINGRHQT